MRPKLPTAFALFLVCVARTEGGVIYDNGPIAINDGGGIGVESNIASQHIQLADDFVLSGGDTIRDVHWWGLKDFGPFDDDFTIQFFNDDAGRPASAPFIEIAVGEIEEVPVDIPAFPFSDFFLYSVNIDPLTLDLGVTYWISIFNNVPNFDWFWATAGVGNASIRADFSPDWSDLFFDTELAFVLTDDVAAAPEPSTLYLLASALGLAGYARRRVVRSKTRVSGAQ